MTIIDHDTEQASRAPLWPAFAFVGRMRDHIESLDREHRMMLDRLVINLVVLAYLFAATRFGLGGTQRELEISGYLIVGYNLVSLALFSAVLGARRMGELRRHIAIWLDLGLVCGLAHVGGSSTAFLYPFILWTIFSNGLRFGQFYLIEATGAALFSFGAVVLTTPFWRDNIALSVGLLIGLIMLPAYLSRPIRSLSGARAKVAESKRARPKRRSSIRYEPAAEPVAAVEETIAEPAAAAEVAAPSPALLADAPETAIVVAPPAPAEPPSQPVAAVPAVVEPAVVAATETSRRSLSILVAEDNRTNQMVIAKILSRAGHKATVVADGKAALDALVANHFDIVLMDLNMPGMNGIDATKLYRFAALGHYVPIVALTADAGEMGEARCRAAGMDACFFKPINPRILLDYLDKVDLNGHAPEVADAPVAPVIPAPLPVEVVASPPPALSVAPVSAEVVAHQDVREPVVSMEASSDRDSDPAIEPVAVATETVAGDPAENSVIDMKALKDLEKLGGQEFVQEIIAQFVGDAAAVLKILSQAVTEGSVTEFREQAHALRSCAANVGARRVYELCLEWRELDAREIASHGRAYMQQLEAEFQATLVRLEEYSKAEESPKPQQDVADAAPQSARAA